MGKIFQLLGLDRRGHDRDPVVVFPPPYRLPRRGEQPRRVVVPEDIYKDASVKERLAEVIEGLGDRYLAAPSNYVKRKAERNPADSTRLQGA